MIYSKAPETTEQHIDKLRSRGLLIPDETRARELLTFVGYYRLSAYTLPFEIPSATGRTHLFQTGTTFDDIVDLYYFDRHLRLLVLDAIEKIEVALRAVWADALSLEMKDSHAHTKPEYFENPWEHLQQLAMTVKGFPSSNEPFISHYRDSYEEPFIPHIWGTVETMTFGSLSKWVKATKSKAVKKRMFHFLGFKNIETLEGTLHAITPIRNVCAHHGRLWNRHFVVRFPAITALKGSLQPNQNPQKSDLRLYNALVILSHLVSVINPRNQWKQRLIDLISKQPEKRLDSMGFPKDWKERDAWKEGAR